MIAATIAAIVAAALGTLLADDLKVWLPRLTAAVLRFAVRRLPADMQSRYAEEWAADLEGTPGLLAPLVSSLGLVFAAKRINGDAKAAALQATLVSLGERVIGTLLLVFVAPLILTIASFLYAGGTRPIVIHRPITTTIDGKITHVQWLCFNIGNEFCRRTRVQGITRDLELEKIAVLLSFIYNDHAAMRNFLKLVSTKECWKSVFMVEDWRKLWKRLIDKK